MQPFGNTLPLDIVLSPTTALPPTPTRVEDPETQPADLGDSLHIEETSPASNGRNKPNEETPIRITTATPATMITPTRVPAATTTEPSTSNNATSRVSTAALAGILIALGVVFVAALAALACIRRKKDQRKRGIGGRRRSPIDDEDEEEKAPPSYEAAVFGSTDNATWNEHYSIHDSPRQPEQPILQSPEPVHHVIHSPRPISAASTTALNRLEPIVTPQQRPVSQEIIIFPHDSPVLGPQDDDSLSLQAALRLSQQSNRVLYSQPTASGRFTENFDDSASVVSELTEEERIAAAEMV